MSLSHSSFLKSTKTPDTDPVINTNISLLDITIKTCEDKLANFNFKNNEEKNSNPDILTKYLVKAADHILFGRDHSAIKLAKKHPEILTGSIERKDPRGRKIKGTLLQIAAATGNIETTDEEKMSVVEQLKELLPANESKAQLDKWFHPGWENETNNRMSPIIAAVEEFIVGISSVIERKHIHIPQSLFFSDTPYHGYHFKRKKLEPTFASCFHKLKTACLANQDEVITSGLIFDFDVLAKMSERILKKLSDNNELNRTDQILWLRPLGLLQGLVSVCDAKFILKGFNPIKLHFNYSFCHYSNPENLYSLELGTTTFIGLNGASELISFSNSQVSDCKIFKSDCEKLVEIYKQKSMAKSNILKDYSPSRSFCLIM